MEQAFEEFVSFGQADTFIGLIGPLYFRNLGDRTETRLVLERRHLNPNGSAHGGLLMTMMDSTLGSTAGAAVGFGGVYPTVQLSCSFLAGAFLDEELRGEAQVERMARTIAFVTGRLRVGDRIVMTGSAVFRNPQSSAPKA
jgi:acyl-coenzyme A thioesterase 13